MKWIGINSTSDTSLADITSVIAGTGLSGGGTTGDVTLNVNVNHDSLAGWSEETHIDWAVASAGTIHTTNIPTLNQDTTGEARTVHGIDGHAPNTATTAASQPNITTLAGVTNIGATGVNTLISSNDVQMFNPVDNGNPSFQIGATSAQNFMIQPVYDSGAQTLDYVNFKSFASSGANKGKFLFTIDESVRLAIDDGGIDFVTNNGISINGTDILTDSSGTATLSNIDALDATTEATIEDAIDTLANLTSVGTIGTGEWRGTAISQTYLTGQSGTNTGDETLSSINALDITEVGTISSGQWRGDAIASAYIAGDAIDGDKIADDAVDSEHYTDGSIDTGHIADDAVTPAKLADSINAAIAANTAKTTNRAYFEFKGFGTSDGTNYEMAELMTDANAPFEHDTSTGSDGLTAQTIQTIIRSGGTVMPRAGTITAFTGWNTSAGSGTVDVGIFKVTPTDDTAGNLTPVLLVNEQTTASGNAKPNSFSESSFSVGFAAGDIIYSAVKGGTASKTWYFTSTLEVQWS